MQAQPLDPPAAEHKIIETERAALLARLAGFQTASLRLSLGQFGVAIGGYLGLIALMYLALQVSIWLTLALSIPAAGFVVKLFIIQHDCGHGSYFRSRRGNEIIGWLCSLVTCTPFGNWRRQHAGHHAMWNNLDHRDAGSDIYSSCLTLQEYQALSVRQQWIYRITRHPLVAQIVLPPLVFLLLYRWPFDTPKSWFKERRSVYLTNLALVAVAAPLVVLLGVGPVLLVQLPVMIVASIVGVWLFSVQHRFEQSEWSRQGQWTALGASLQGSSRLKLPAVLQWMTGNIGFHHIHHLLPRVPNYNLAACDAAGAGLTARVTTLTFRDAFRAPGFVLWDESLHRMVRFPR